ncbi:MAG: glycosyl hydrolase-related protein [Gemmatimonadaceae bacterium]|nr:glycosyl hydrolase-related protein [Gemmatimonadaceae bacterium]
MEPRARTPRLQPAVTDHLAPPHVIVVVPHTHWDREWYHPVGRFRQRLAALVDALLDDDDALPFLLDGQAIVLDDYAALRPDRMAALDAALAAGRVEAGPWYVLADQLIAGGEALVRNLLEGTRTLHEAGAAPPPVLYSPDAFGHSHAGPLLADGFGFRVAIAWRGLGGPSHPASTVMRWAHASGAQVLLYHLPTDGYEVGSALPTTMDGAVQRWRTQLRDALTTRNPVRIALLPNGADHHARQPQLAEALAALSVVAAPHTVRAGTLADFARQLHETAQTLALPTITGELRDSRGWTWSLQGTFATRAHQKRRNAHVERLLLREAEPWAALAWFVHGVALQPALRHAWKTLLATHPHDTLCGCSIDDVARAADVRWDDAEAQGRGVRDDALALLVRHDAVRAREAESSWQPTLVFRNPSPRLRSGVVQVSLRDQPIPDPVGPGSAARSGARLPAPPAPLAWSGEALVQQVARRRAIDRVESPQHYPRNALVREIDAYVWVEPLEGFAIVPVPAAQLDRVIAAAPQRERIRASGNELVGATWRVTSGPQGIVAAHQGTGLRLQPLGWLESTSDAGDTYTPSLRGSPLVAHWGGHELGLRGPLCGSWEARALLERRRTWVTPVTEPLTREAPSREVAQLPFEASLSIVAGAEWLRVDLRGENGACDHRLRWVVPLPGSLQARSVIADAALGPVTRPRDLRDPASWTAERQLATAPLHRWVLVLGEGYGVALISDGLAEYEITDEGQLAVTLVRAVGELSRRDIPERPGHAGWPAATPLAQSLGPVAARFAWLVTSPDRDTALAQVEAAADDVLAPMTATTWRDVPAQLPPFEGLTLDGDGLAFSACKRSEDGEWLVLRCINLRDTTVTARWRTPRPVREAMRSRLDETPLEALRTDGATVAVEVGPFAVSTVLVR